MVEAVGLFWFTPPGEFGVRDGREVDSGGRLVLSPTQDDGTSHRYCEEASSAYSVFSSREGSLFRNDGNCSASSFAAKQRQAAPDTDEILYTKGNRVVLETCAESQGASVNRESLVIKSFEHTLEATQALLCSLSGDDNMASGKCICVLQREDCIKVYSPDGAEFEVALPCRASRMWALPQGLLIERATSGASDALDASRRAGMEYEDNAGLATMLEESRIDQSGPVYFSLLHPLEELKPVSYSSAHQGSRSRFLGAHQSSQSFFASATEDHVDFMCDPNERIVHCGRIAHGDETLTIMVTYNKMHSKHSVWSLLPSESFETRTTAEPRRASVSPDQVKPKRHKQVAKFDLGRKSPARRHRMRASDMEDETGDTDGDGADDGAIESELFMRRIWPPAGSPNGKRRSSGSRRLFLDEECDGAGEMGDICDSLNSLNRPADVIFVAHDSDDACSPLLYLLCTQLCKLFALRFAGGALSTAFALQVRDAQPINATGSAQCVLAGEAVLDTVILTLDYALELYRGNRKLCCISFPSRLPPRLLHPRTSEVPLSPVFFDAVSQRGGLNDDAEMVLSPVEADGSFISASSRRLSSSSIAPRGENRRVIRLRDAVDDRVTLYVRSEGHVRVRVPLVPQSALVQRCFTALYAHARIPRSVALAFHVETMGWYSQFVNADALSEKARNALTKAYSALDVDCCAGQDVEWLSFIVVVSTVFLPGTKPLTQPDQPTVGAFDAMMQSGFHNEFASTHAAMSEFFDSLQSERPEPAARPALQWWNEISELRDSAWVSRVDAGRYVDSVFESLHLLYEECKLSNLDAAYLMPLSNLLAGILGAVASPGCERRMSYLDHYARDMGCLSPTPMPPNRSLCTFCPAMPPASSHETLREMLEGNVSANPIPMSAAYTRSCDLLLMYSLFTGRQCTSKGAREYWTAFDAWKNANGYVSRSPAGDVVLCMVWRKFSLHDIASVPYGVALPLRECLRACRDSPSDLWPYEGFQLVGREDISAFVLAPEKPYDTSEFRAAKGKHDVSKLPTLADFAAMDLSSFGNSMPLPGARASADFAKLMKSVVIGQSDFADEEDEDGEASIRDETGFRKVILMNSLRFGKDGRLGEVCRLLDSSAAPMLVIDRKPEMTDHDVVKAQQRHLLLLCKRLVSLPVGRGAFTLGTLQPTVTEQIPIPAFSLSGRIPPNDHTIKLDKDEHEKVYSSLFMWPEFHNGVAAALRISAGVTALTRTWIEYNRPEKPTYAHAGFLLGLGLQGHLTALSMPDTYGYLQSGHCATTVGILLGMGAARRGSMEPRCSKMLCLHIPSLLPVAFAEMDVPAEVQAAAIVGVGLLYQGTAHRLMTEFLLAEIGKRADSDKSSDRESYSLAAGFALGMVTLGQGSVKGGLAGLADLHLEDRLHRYMVGGKVDDAATIAGQVSDGDGKSSSAASFANDAGKCSRVHEGPYVNIDVTASGATIALALMFLKSGNKAVAERLSIPDTHFLLDYVRPDLLMLRVFARCLVLWDDVLASPSWVGAQVPKVIRESYDLLVKEGVEGVRAAMTTPPPFAFHKNAGIGLKKAAGGGIADEESIRESRSFIVAGACLGIGIRYAGTSSKDARNTLLHYLEEFGRLRAQRDEKGASGKREYIPDSNTLEICIGSCSMAVALVMAGTGDLKTLGILRALMLKVEDKTYGHHMCISSAIGILFLGGGRHSFSRSKEAIAALVCAVFPRYPFEVGDHQYHLQALRHLYVLAAEPRCIETFDVDTMRPCYTPLKISVKHTESGAEKEGVYDFVAPCLLPPLEWISKIEVSSPRYWQYSIDMNIARAFSTVRTFLTLCVKRRAGQLGYEVDPNGVSSLLARPRPILRFTDGKPDPTRSVENFRSFSADPKVLAFTEIFCKLLEQDPTMERPLSRFEALSPPRNKGLRGEDGSPDSLFAEFCTSVLYECLTDDKTEAIFTYLSLYKAARTVLTATTSLDIANLHIVFSFYKEGRLENLRNDEADRMRDAEDAFSNIRPLIQKEFLLGISYRFSEALCGKNGNGSFARDPDGSNAISRYYKLMRFPETATLQSDCLGKSGVAISGPDLARRFALCLAFFEFPAPCKLTAEQRDYLAQPQKLHTAKAASVIGDALCDGALTQLMSVADLLPEVDMPDISQLAIEIREEFGDAFDELFVNPYWRDDAPRWQQPSN